MTAIPDSATQIIGSISPGRPLLVLAVQEEAQFLPEGLPVLITGIGKINTTLALTTALARGVLPSGLVNLGTAGALRPGRAGVHEVGTVIQHDLDTDLLFRLTGRTYGAPLRLSETGVVLASGDTFVAGGPRRDELAARADLVDMEGYAVAAVAARFGLPVRLVKQVSDDADENAARSWPVTVRECARELAGWVDRELGRGHGRPSS